MAPWTSTPSKPASIALAADRYGRLAIMQIDMADPSDMPELHEDAAAPGVNGIRDFSPARNLLCRVDAGGVLIALRLLGHLGRLCDDEAGTRALGVVFCSQCAWHETRTGAVAGQGRHDDMIGKRDA